MTGDGKGAGDWKGEAARWSKELLEPVKDRFPLRKESFSTTAGLELGDLPLPAEGEYPLEDLSFPGQFPFTRGIQPSMYRGRFWTMRQYAGFGSARESNERYRYLLDQGQTGLSVAFDLPTQMGRDSDHPLSLGEVGKVGVAIDTLADMEVLLEAIPLDRVSVSMTINATAAILLSMVVAVAEKQGVEAKRLRGTIQNDLLKEYIARGTYIYPPRPSMRIITDIFAHCGEHLPLWNTISISGYHIREAGADAVQEVAFTLADGLAYVEAAREAGLRIEEFGRRLSFFFNAHNNFLEEIAKFRAARRLWARLMKERYGATGRAAMLRFHTQTAGSTLTAQQPHNNVVRVAFQALAAVLGGTQSLHTNSYDEALCLPTEEAVSIALRTQQIIAHESGVGDVVDPLAGSYLIEDLTDRIEAEAREYIERIDAMGGMVAAIEAGYVQQEIQDRAYDHQVALEKEERIVVGVNRFTRKEPPVANLLRVKPEVEAAQLESLRGVKEGRSQEDVNRALERLESAAKGEENLLPFILEAVRVYASVGEISDVFREVFGEYRPLALL